MRWGNAVYCVQLSGEDLSHYWNEIEPVGLRKCSYYYYLTKKEMSQLQTFLTVCHTSWRKNSWHRYAMEKLRHCHPMYTYSENKRITEQHDGAKSCFWARKILFSVRQIAAVDVLNWTSRVIVAITVAPHFPAAVWRLRSANCCIRVTYLLSGQHLAKLEAKI